MAQRYRAYNPYIPAKSRPTLTSVVHDGGKQRHTRPADDGHQRGGLEPELLECLRSSCLALGRAGDLQRVSSYLDEEWLRTTADLAGLSEAGWLELRLPIGLKEELKRLLPLRLGTGRRSAGAAWPDLRQKATADGSRLAQRPPSPIRQSHPHGSAARQSAQEADRCVSEDESDLPPESNAILDRLRSEIKRRGSDTMQGLARRFRVMDDDHSNRLNFEEFTSGLEDLHIGASKSDMETLWNKFDCDGSGLVSFDEVVALLRGGLNSRRRHAVHVLFKSLDVNGNGALQLDDLRMRYDPSVLGEVRARPPDEVLMNFLKNLKVAMDIPEAVGDITLRDFERYYDKISASIDSDEYFEEVLRRAWGLPEGWVRAFGSPVRHQRPVPSRPGPGSGNGILDKVRQALGRDVPYGPRIIEASKPSSERWGGALLAARAAAKFRHAARSAQGTVAGVPSSKPEAAQPSLPRGEFESLLRRLCPELAASDPAVLCALFGRSGDAGPSGDAGVDYARFLQELRRREAEAHRAVAGRLFEELAGAGAREIHLGKFGRRVPDAVRDFFGEDAKVARGDWLLFHDTPAAAAVAAGSGPEAYEADLRRAWGMHAGPRSRSQPAHEVNARRLHSSDAAAEQKVRTRPAYYKGISTVQLG